VSHVNVKVDVFTEGDAVVCVVRHGGQEVRLSFSPSAGLDIKVPEDESKAARDDG
jgi:hypothetical protein